ncbi:E3 ubiquitin-protein ligase parkin-like [Gigantopelta aegis]|uniref:E3 ubiquitin-protein ligase parkin-like n=1 Tax=Gigantopelta aegis TaxID=1735272 RepID=UPI001B887E0B|nr:E3 ubiquitin-protein ligase parkin-like [Gigantopelta aegis]
MLHVNIKYNSNWVNNVDVDPSVTVRELKQRISNDIHLPVDRLGLILGGQLLQDDAVLQDCDIGQQSVLHAFHHKVETVTTTISTTATPTRNQYFVYCKLCKALRPAKLRVKCALCKDGAFMVERGPDNWEDVLQHTRIKGSCQNVACSGDVAGVVVDRLGLILGGQLLQDDAVLQDCDIGQQSVLHAFHHKVETVTTTISTTATPTRNQYFVYCKLCKALRPAKLRVKCALCKDGAFMVERGPDNWEDVLQHTRIKGSCQNVACSGDVAEFHFKCAESHPGNVDETAIVLQHVYPNWCQVECICCATVRSPVLVYPCADSHVTCLECFRLYGITKLDERRFEKHDIYTIPCPAGCPDSYIKESHHFRLLGDDQYDRYNRFATEEYVLQDGGVLCPGPGCGMGLMLEPAQRKVTCVSNSCQMTFCRDCHLEYHNGPCRMRSMAQAGSQNFSIDRVQAERARWEVQTQTVICETTKPCPRCHTRTERDGGCMHMACPRCNLEWCWMCQKPWDNDCVADHWFG